MRATPAAVCKVCMKDGLDSEEGIGIEYSCGRWFHRAVVNICKSEYIQCAKDSKKKWGFCRVDCSPFNRDPINIMITSVNKLMEHIESWCDQIDKTSEYLSVIVEIKTYI